MLWIKALHIAFVVCWFSGIFYLPRLFVNSAIATDPATQQQLVQMQQKLYRFMSLLAAFAVLFGGLLLASNWSYYIGQGWMQLKLALVALLVAYHLLCGHYVRQFAQASVTKSERFFRLFNEAPVALLFGIVILAVVRPF